MRQLQGHDCPVRALAYSPDGNVLASGDEGGVLCLWSLPAAELVEKRELDHGSIEALAFSPRGEPLAIATATDVLALASGALASVCNEGARGLAWHSGGDLLVVGTWAGVVHFWTRGWAARRAPLPIAEPITALTSSPDGKSLALVAATGLVYVLNTANWRPRWQTKQPRGSYALACSRDNVLATGETNGDIVLWNVQDGSELRKLAGHTWTIYGLAFTPDGEHLVSGSADGTVRLWEPATGRARETFRWHSKWVTSVAISPDGMTAAAASADHSIVVWDLADA
jgi:WD40 repeat protein